MLSTDLVRDLLRDLSVTYTVRPQDRQPRDHQGSMVPAASKH